VSEFTDDLVDGNQLARDELADIQKVPVPSDSTDQMKAVVASRARQLDAIDKLIVAARANDRTKFEALANDVKSARQTALREAQGFGFQVCGSDTASPTAR
jgi:hypothetical protein